LLMYVCSFTVTSACNLVQVVRQPPGVFKNSKGMKSSTCIDHIFTNVAKIYFKAVSNSIGCSDDNKVAISETKGLNAGPNTVYKRSYSMFCSESYVDDVKNICWSLLYNEEQPGTAHDTFMKLSHPDLFHLSLCLSPPPSRSHPSSPLSPMKKYMCSLFVCCQFVLSYQVLPVFFPAILVL
jgi:hypothetical protein